jgi:uncharacterized PurR-regulated membrane protein YhhQ (DUF165 family)
MKIATWFLIYVGCVIGANWAIATFGVVPVGLGLFAPAGVWFAGASFTARDMVQRHGGRKLVLLAVVVGAVLSFALSYITPNDMLPSNVSAFRLSFGSGLAFLVSEFLDFAVYTPIHKRSWILAVVVSNTVGAAVDSLLFLLIVFGSLDFFAGQFVGKSWMTLLVLIVFSAYRLAQRDYNHNIDKESDMI